MKGQKKRVSKDFDFINRALVIAAIITFLVVISSFVYYNKNFALGALAGGAWNIINIYFLTRLVKVTFSPASPAVSGQEGRTGPKSPNKKKIAYLVFIKFPLLYGAGFLILRYSGVSLYGVLVGFSIFFLVISLKAIGAAIVDRSSAYNS